MKRHLATLTTAISAFLLVSCSSTDGPNQPLATFVDIERFMGEWRVHGYTPTAIDKNAWNAVETYELRDDGKIQTTYSFNKGSATGKQKTYRPVGTIYDTKTNAEWRMRFFGIINAPYYIVYVSPDYQYTVIGHPNRKYAWIMSRESSIDEERYDALLNELRSRDYQIDRIERVRHQ